MIKLYFVSTYCLVALAQRLFPTEAQVAMNIAQVKGTSEFTVSSLDPDYLVGAKRTSPFKILEEHQSRLKALSKTGMDLLNIVILFFYL